MDTQSRTCPACGRDVETDAARFCPFCGAELAPSAPAQPGGLDALRAAYGGYDAWVEDYFRTEGTGSRLLSIVTGNGAFKNSPEHTAFLAQVAALAAALAPEERIPALRFALLDCHDGRRQEVEWMFLAAEKEFIPLAERLSAAEAAELYPAYRALRRRAPGFPVQTTLLKTLKKRGAL